ncbi:hypothetical protein RhiJN_24142 [Ceratobasidium sp. AG-Ba]|nr:hypothetical protein RhiJN_24142 [Ceratobasidium sp. AG-Ba]
MKQAFFFFGFLVAGQEIENPFGELSDSGLRCTINDDTYCVSGYDENDLNLDKFCRDIIHGELKALISISPSSYGSEFWNL